MAGTEIAADRIDVTFQDIVAVKIVSVTSYSGSMPAEVSDFVIG